MKSIKKHQPTESAMTDVTSTIVKVLNRQHVPWVLIGGQALQAHGVPRNTLDEDIMVPLESLVGTALMLAGQKGWKPLRYSKRTGDYVIAPVTTIHHMDDPVLYDVGQQRAMIPLLAPGGVIVELLAAQHPVESDMIDGALVAKHRGCTVPLAPLGGILLVKVKADRTKDVAAIEQTAESLPNAELRKAIKWAEKRDPATAQDLASIIDATKLRRNPIRTRKAR
jgi:hypothetical protein